MLTQKFSFNLHIASLGCLMLVLLASGFVDLPTRYRLGATSLSGALTIAYALAAVFLFLLSPNMRASLLRTFWPFLLFYLWSLLSFLWFEPNTYGMQNISVLTGWMALILLAARTVHHHPESMDQIERWFKIAVWLGAGIYTVSIFREGLEAKHWIGPRSFALFALIGICWFLAEWRTGRSSGLLYALLLSVGVGLSLSRLGLVAAILLFPLAMFRVRNLKSWLLTLVGGFFAILILYFVITQIPAISNRFFSGDMTFSVGSISINGMGRTNMWTTTLQSFLNSPWIGQGPGSASKLISATYPPMNHPHNDYLRILHDYGLIGFSLWIAGMALLARRLVILGDQAMLPGDRRKVLYKATFLIFCSVAMGMMTDNVLVFQFVIAPFGILIGTSLGSAQPVPVPMADFVASPTPGRLDQHARP